MKIKTCFLFFCFSLSLFGDSSYDSYGSLEKISNSEKGEVCYQYDPIHRLQAAHYSNGPHFSYSYDYNSRLKTIDGPHGKTLFSHHLSGQVEEVTLPSGKKITYRYDTGGHLTELVYPDGESVHYTYDARGRLREVKSKGGLSKYEYDDLTNLILKETLPNGISTSYVYDGDLNISEVSHVDGEGALLTKYQYSYDAKGNCNTLKEIRPNHTILTTYRYDSLDRLVYRESDDGTFERYTYDPIGNRLSKETHEESIHYVYDHHNRLIQEGEIDYSYDSFGNLTQKKSPSFQIRYSYDPTGKLISFEEGSQSVKFEYDGLGQRISKTVNGKTTYFINDPIAPLSRVLMEVNSEGEVKKYIYGLSRFAVEEERAHSYFLYSHPGKSISHLIDEQGKVHPLKYDSFGISSDHPPQLSYGFNGEEKDCETGLIFLRQRYYDPSMGRFISPDFLIGDLTNPQTLNPYIFVLNNPISYIDPNGLSATKVPLTIYCNPPRVILPNGEKSWFGHGWIGGVTENGESFSIGVYPGPDFRPHDIPKALCKETVRLDLWITPQLQERAIKAINDGGYCFFGNNCIDHVVKALDAIKYPHPYFKVNEEWDNISNPAYLHDWILSERNHIHPNFLPQKGDILVGETSASNHFSRGENHPSYINLHFSRPNYGGVLLDKSAEVLTKLSDISGVIYDEKMGQMILYGHKNVTFPHMDMDDLAVAVRSIYGLGTKGPESPGVSMDLGTRPEGKKNKTCMVVSYFGETENTRFGQIMFEADRVLKVLSIGKDDVTEKPIKSSVAGYRNLQTLRFTEGRPSGDGSCRMWFVPKRITLSESQDGTSMVFNETRMEVLTESTFKKKGVRDKAAEKFASHFTEHYDDFSKEYPILTELKRLGKITAIVKWIHEKNLPFDLSFFQNYAPYYRETPKYSPIIGEMLGGELIVGGVVYTLNSGNYLIQKSGQADQIKKEILRERPNDEALSWNFGRNMTAVVKQVGKSLKVGEVRKTFVDLSYSGGNIPLSFVRTYSSFNETSCPFGRGWECVPAKICFHQGLTSFSFSDGTALNLYPQITLQLEGMESVYTLAGLTQEKEPLYKKEKSPFYLVQDSQGSFTWHRQNETLTFNSKGQLTHLFDLSGRGLEYHYDQGYLIQISHSSGETISLEYIDKKLHSITGPGGKTLYYGYDSQGRLQKVHDAEGTLTSYGYDHGHRLTTIYNGKGIPLFSAKYDNHHRAIEQTVGENVSTQSFNLRDHSASFETATNTYQHQYDPEYRLKRMEDALGREIEFTYGENGSQKIVTSSGFEIEYKYDDQGRLITVSNAYEGTRSFSYNPQGKIICEIDGSGNKIRYQYDPLGRLIAIYDPLLLKSIRFFNNQTEIEASPDYLTTFEYDEETSLLKSITFPDGRKETYDYSAQGLPTHIKLANGTTITREYDASHHLVKVQTQGKTIEYDYDHRDHITKITSQGKAHCFHYDLSGNLTSYSDPLRHKTEYHYDSYEKLIETIDPLKQSTTYEYGSSGLCKMHLPNGSTREILYDEYSRPVAMR
jgi:RHS repeat-associated protein